MCQCQCEPKRIVDPNQQAFIFPMDCESESYKEGYETGMNWDANWMPGGPFVVRPNGRNDALYAAQKKAHEEYLAGFKRGLDIRLDENLVFKKWWDLHYRGPIKRYVEALAIES